MSEAADQGFEILPDVFDGADLSPVLRALDQTGIPSGRAGRRRVLRGRCEIRQDCEPARTRVGHW